MNIQGPQAVSQESTETIGTWRVTYAPGEWVALAGPDALVVMPPAPARAGRFLTRLWESVVPTASIDDLVAELGRAGVTDMPDMVALFWDAGSMHSLVRGRLRVVDPATGDVIASGEGVRTWNEIGLGDIRAVAIVPADEAPAGDDVLHLPLVVGAARVGSLLVETSPDRLVKSPPAAPRASVVEPARTEAPRHDTSGWAAPAEQRAGATAGGLAAGAAALAAGGLAAGIAAGAAAGAAGAGVGAGAEHPGGHEAEHPHGQVYDPVHPESDEPSAVHHHGAPAGVHPADTTDDEPRTAELAAVPPAWDEPQAGDRQGTGAGREGRIDPDDAAAEDMDASLAQQPQAAPVWDRHAAEAGRSGPDSATELLDVSSGAPGPAPDADATAPMAATELLDVPEGATGPSVPLETPAAPGAAQPSGPAGVSGTGLIGAAASGAGASAAGQGTPRERAQQERPQEERPQEERPQEERPQEGPSPVMAMLRPITGAPVTVDRPVLIGRAPQADKAGGGRVPKLMTVPSPSHDISRTHVKVEPVGRTVQVTDLHSTNGTVLITGPVGGDPSLAGQRHQLVPGEPVAVQPGWILDLGDGVTILIDRA